MARPIFLGNGSMLVGLDTSGLVHDFYYPYVGLENHSNEQDNHHRIGLFVDGQMSWLDDDEWDIRLNYEPHVMIGALTAVNEKLQLAIETYDFVDIDFNAFCRNIHVINNSDQKRDIKLFMHQAFRIAGSNRGDTALFVPEGNYILDYKGRRSFLIFGETAADGKPFDQYSIGVHGIEGKSGTYADAEDGELSNHPVEHGSVDSTIRFSLNLDPRSSARVNYWVAAAGSHEDALNIHNNLVNQGFDERHDKTQAKWQEWLEPARKFKPLITPEYINNVEKSLLIVKSHMDRRGSVLASGDSEMLNYARDNYSYCWPRDGAYAIWPMIRLGYHDEPKAFFEFVRDVLSENGSLKHKFQPDRAVGSTWHPLIHGGKPELAIQEDETASVIFMMHQYLLASDDEDFVRRFYSTLIQPAANFMENFIDENTSLPHASYDLWEEKFLTSTYTVATVYAGLTAAAKMAERFEYPDDAIRWQTVADEIKIAAEKLLYNKDKNFFYKGFVIKDDGSLAYDDTIDLSSLYGAFTYELFSLESREIMDSLKTLEDDLMIASPSGGVPRYEYDQYCRSPDPKKGNPWFVTTLWIAQLYLQLDRRGDALNLINWTQDKMLKSGVLAEQIDPVTGEFRSVAPLIWSHAEFVNTILDLA